MKVQVSWLRTLVFQYNAEWDARECNTSGGVTLTVGVKANYKRGYLKRPLRVWLRSQLQRESLQRWDELECSCHFRVNIDLHFTTLSGVLPRRRNKQAVAFGYPTEQEIFIAHCPFKALSPVFRRRMLERFSAGLS